MALGDAAKTCTRCGLTKPVGEYGVRARSADGLNAQCAECRRESRKASDAAYRARNRTLTAVRDTRSDVATCTKCGTEHPVGEFPRDATRASGRHPWCRDCRKDGGRRYYKENREELLAKTSARQQTEEVRARSRELARTPERRAKKRALYAKNPERYRAINKRDRERRRDAVREQKAAWRAANYEHVRELNEANRARIQAETASAARRHHNVWTGPELEQVIRDDIPLRDIALMLGRTYAAASTARRRALTEPKYQRLAGVEGGEIAAP